MTIVITTRESMASDSQTTSSYGIASCAKIFRLKIGGVVGISGTLVDGLLFVEWLKSGAEGKPPPMRFVEAVLLKDGRIWHYDSSTFAMKVTDKVAAIGSGAQFALGAYYAGASVGTAVKIACRLDPYSGGRVKELKG